MKHFNFKTLAMGAALAGSLFTTNAHAQDLADVNITTLQWNGGGRYAGLNGGKSWSNMGNTFGNPNGGNGRIGIIKKGDGTYALASQGIYLTVDAEGNKGDVYSLEEATGFTVTQNGEGELVFKSADGIFLNGSGGNNNIGTAKEIGENDGFKMNSWGDYKLAKQDLFDVGNGVFMATLCLPYNVSTPDGVKAYVITVEGEELVTTEVTDIPGGTPFICVGGSNQAHLNIPQENQSYAVPSLSTTALTGWYLSASTDYSWAIENGIFGYYSDKAHGKAKDVNTGGISKEIADALGAAYFAWNAETSQLVAVQDPTEVINAAIALVAQLSELKANEGTNPGQYNVTEEAVGAEGWAIWNNLEGYDAADDAAYASITVKEAKALVEQLGRLADAVKACMVDYDLGLSDVSVVTLQWGGTGRYVGLNGGERTWEASYSMGSPNNGNARVGIVKRADGKYAVACQGLYLVADGDDVPSGTRVTNPDEATGFNVTRSSENGLTFVTDDGWYMYFNGADVRLTKDASLITTDFKVNTFQFATYANQDLTQVSDGLYMAAISLPFKVQKPTVEGVDNHIYTVTVENGQIVTTEVEVTEAGVPFIYVSNVNSDDAKRLIIPQENQAYAAPSTATAMKGWYQQYQYGTDDDPKNYYFAVRNGVFGFYTDAAPANVNQAAISGEAVKELGAAFFTWNVEAKKLEAATNTAKVTYNVSYNGAIVKSEVATSVLGDKFAVPSTLAAPFTTFSLSAEDSTKVVEGDCEVTLYAAWNAPFEVSTSLEEAHWYNLDIRNGHWVRVQATEPYQPIAKGDVDNATLRTAEYQWAFMGDPYNLYIYNKSTGEMTLKAEDSAPLMREGQYSWELLDNNQGADAFVLRVRGTAQKYINQEGGGGNGRKFGYWDNGGARNDGGSTFRVYEVPLLVNEAIALFMELNKVVTDVAMNPDNYEYTYTEADNALLDGGYEDAAAYEGKSEEEVLALMAEFQALINRLKDARPTGLKALNIVTLKWNNYVTLTAEGKWAGIIAPNDAYGKIAIIKKEAGYLLSAQGMYLKVNDDQTTAIVADEAEATLLTIKGTVADGLTISANGLYLTGEELSVVAERPTQTYKVNEYANTNLIATKEEMVEAATKLYMSDFCFPFSVTKPENEKEHHFYTLQVADLESEEEVNIIEMVEVDTVMAGVPFIYITNSKEDTETRLVILPDSAQTYAATPATEGLLNGYYMIPTVEEGNFYYGEEDWYYGYYNTAKPQSANGAYITAAAAEAITAVKFWFDDMDLVFKATNANGVDITTGISPVVNHAVNGAIYNLQGVRVAQPTKGIYIINDQKVVVK